MNFDLKFIILSGIRKELYIWDVKTEQLVKCLDAHFARIVEIQPLTIQGCNKRILEVFS